MFQRYRCKILTRTKLYGVQNKIYGFFPLSDVHDNASAMTELLAVLKGLVGGGDTVREQRQKDKRLGMV